MGGGGGMHTSNRDGQYWSMENQHALLKERLTLKHHSAGLPGPSISRGPDRHFSFVALAGETAFKYNLPERERHLHTEQGCVWLSEGREGKLMRGGGGGGGMHLHQAAKHISEISIYLRAVGVGSCDRTRWRGRVHLEAPPLRPFLPL